MIKVAPPRILSPSPETLFEGRIISEAASIQHNMGASKPYLPCRAETRRRGKVFALQNVEADCKDDNAEPAAPCPPTPDPPAGDASTLPTADDYASLCFCDPSDEEESRTSFITQPMKSRTSSVMDATASIATHRNKRRRVSFGACIPTVHPLEDVPLAHAMTPEERSTAWFNRSDLEGLKASAQETIQAMRARIVAKAHECKDRSKFRSEMLLLEEETDSSIRGLEHRVFRRKKTRQMLIRDVLECQSHIKGLARFGHAMDPNEKLRLLSKASRERSAGARGVAFADAKDDYEEVYGDACAEAGADARISKRQRQLGQTRQVSM